MTNHEEAGLSLLRSIDLEFGQCRVAARLAWGLVPIPRRRDRSRLARLAPTGPIPHRFAILEASLRKLATIPSEIGLHPHLHSGLKLHDVGEDTTTEVHTPFPMGRPILHSERLEEGAIGPVHLPKTVGLTRHIAAPLLKHPIGPTRDPLPYGAPFCVKTSTGTLRAVGVPSDPLASWFSL